MKINPEVAKFISLFLISLSVFYFISIRFESSIPFFSMKSTTEVLYSLLKAIGINVSAGEYNIIFPSFSLEIIRQCTGIFEVITIVSCILAFPSSVKKKIVGITLAVPIIYLFNMGRLVFLSVLGIYYLFLFSAVHEYLLQLTFVFLVVFFWIFWTKRVVKNEKG